MLDKSDILVEISKTEIIYFLFHNLNFYFNLNQDEVIHLPSDEIALPTGAAKLNVDGDEEDIMLASGPIKATATAQQQKTGMEMLTTSRDAPVTLTPPEALFKSPEYPSLQIMVSG